MFLDIDVVKTRLCLRTTTDWSSLESPSIFTTNSTLFGCSRADEDAIVGIPIHNFFSSSCVRIPASLERCPYAGQWCDQASVISEDLVLRLAVSVDTVVLSHFFRTCSTSDNGLDVQGSLRLIHVAHVGSRV